MKFAQARRIADAVLYEGYVLYPYRPSSIKNRFRWQFGVIAPRVWSEYGGEPWEMQTECLVRPRPDSRIDITIRFLQVLPNEDGWEEGEERTIDLASIPLHELAAGRDFGIHVPPIRGIVCIELLPLPNVLLHKLRVRIENITDLADPATVDRATAIRHSLVGTHTLLAVENGEFVSLMDPPPEARSGAAVCRNLHTWPVLVGAEGDHATMLSSPIILHDYPAIAPESQGDFCDATEIDELLTLRVMTLTDEEKREASNADERARRIIERSDSIPPEIFERLHGAIRSVRPEPFYKGRRVRMMPRRRADSMDLFLAGRIARVEAVERDFEDRVYVAVSVEDDPAADMNSLYGRFYYFYPDELEPLEIQTQET
jgi:hypothetical protein